MNDKSVYITPRFYVFASDEEESVSSGSSSVEDQDKPVRAETSTSSQLDPLVDQVTLTNHLLVGIILFIGVFFGAFCMAHLYNRIRKD